MAHSSELFPQHPALPAGCRYDEDFLDPGEEGALVAAFASLPFEAARYKEWTARRRVVSYGGSYDFAQNLLLAAPPIPQFMLAIKARAAAWAGVRPDVLEHAVVAEYRAGTPLGWHRDAPAFGIVIGISLLGRATMRFRPYPHVPGSRARSGALELAPRSIYVLGGEARSRWQHAIAPTEELRYSITFRTLRREHFGPT